MDMDGLRMELESWLGMPLGRREFLGGAMDTRMTFGKQAALAVSFLYSSHTRNAAPAADFALRVLRDWLAGERGVSVDDAEGMARLRGEWLASRAFRELKASRL